MMRNENAKETHVCSLCSSFHSLFFLPLELWPLLPFWKSVVTENPILGLYAKGDEATRSLLEWVEPNQVFAIFHNEAQSMA